MLKRERDAEEGIEEGNRSRSIVLKIKGLWVPEEGAKQSLNESIKVFEKRANPQIQVKLLPGKHLKKP
jgi:hypothetical protein